MPSSTSDDRWLPNHKPFGHQHHGLRHIDRLQPEQQGAERVDRLLAVSDAVGRHPFGLHLQGGGAEFQRGSERLVGALAGDQVIELEAVAALHRDRLGQCDLILAEAPCRALADHPRDHLLHPLAVGGEWRRRRAGTDADGSHSIRRLKTIQEAVEGGTDAHRAAESDVRLIDKEHDQPSAGGVLVGAVPGGGGAAPGRSGVASDTHSALTTRRATPWMRTAKSAG